jgi:penicillin-binding protein 1A
MDENIKHSTDTGQLDTDKPRKKKHNKAWRIIMFLFLFIFLTGIIFFGGLFLSVYYGLTGPIPTNEELLEIRKPLASEVFSVEGKLLGRYYLENRSHVQYEEISPNIVHALIATEDSRFYEHRGIDEIALMRVLFKTIMQNDRSAGGGSTLSQQIAKNIYPRKNLGIISMPVNKLREAIIAYRLERVYTKEEIITLYLNTVPFGENVFGIEVATERYFNKKPSDISVDQAAVLIGLLKANESYNPRKNPEKAKNRRNVVIDLMVHNNYLSEEEGRKYKDKPLEIKYYRISYNEGPSPYFLEMLKPELLKWCKNNQNEEGKPYNLYTDGLQIKTTLRYDFQYYAEQAVGEHMKKLQELFDKHWEKSKPWTEQPEILERAIRQSERYKALKVHGKSKAEINKTFNEKIEANLLFPDGLHRVETTPLDSLKHYLKTLHAGFLALDPHTGEILAWIGGIDFRIFKFDHVNAPRQTGSTFKPFVYLAGLESGLSPTDYFSAQKRVYKQYQNWSPRNSHDEYDGYYTMEGALAKSINTVSVDILMKAGLDNVIETVHELGIKADLPHSPAIALGSSSISLKEMVTGYATILAGGIRVQPNYLVTIQNKRGEVLYQAEKPVAEQANIGMENCFTMIRFLQSVIDEGTGRSARNKYNLIGEFAGKTGTTQDHSDGWFIGMNPKIVAGCWVGADDPRVHFRTITYGQGAFMALPIVAGFFHRVYSNPKYQYLATEEFPKPDTELLVQLDMLPPHVQHVRMAPSRKYAQPSIEAAKPSEGLVKTDNKEKPKEEKKEVWKSIQGIFKKK